MINWRIYERDVDIILAEEFYSSASFASWFLSFTKLFCETTAEVTEVDVSLSDERGESDLVIVFERPDKTRFALLIEDKIDAGFQPDQVGRYRSRGQKGLTSKRWQSFEVLLCAPRAYIEKNPIAADFDATVSYEDIATWLRANMPGRRGEYRAAFLSAAAPRGATAYRKQTDSETDAFWNEAYVLAGRDFPDLEMKKPNYASNANWVIFRPKFFGARVSVDLKAIAGSADLSFSKMSPSVIFNAVESIKAPEMIVTQAGASAVIRMKFPEFSVAEGPEIVATKVQAAFVVCRNLVNFYRKHQSMLDDILNSPKPTGADNEAPKSN